MHRVHAESLERKRSFLKSLPLTEICNINFPFNLTHYLTCSEISLLVNLGKVDNDFPHVSVTESHQVTVHLYFTIGAWKYWFQTWFCESCLFIRNVQEKISSSISTVLYYLWSYILFPKKYVDLQLKRYQ